MKRLVSLIVLAVLVFCAANVAVASAALGELSFVEPEKVTATYSGERSGEVSVWLKNDGAEEVTPEFATVLEDGDGEPAAASVEVVGEGTAAGKAAPLAAGQVGRFRLVFVKPSKSSGQLVASAVGVESATVPLSIGPDLSSTRGINAALVIPLVIAVVWLIIAWFLGHGNAGLRDKLGGTAELDFSKSFASTLTAVGALLGTIIAAGVLPEETVKLSRGGFVGLNLTFGVAIVIAAAVAASFLSSEAVKNKEGKNEWKVEGYVWPFMLSALITLWAVFGELYAISLLIGELGSGEGFTSLGVTMLRVLLIGGGLALLPYTVIKIKVAVRKPEVAETMPVAETAPPRVFEIKPAAAGEGDQMLTVEIPTEAVPTGEAPSPPIQLL
ncbi:MAG TPA: hypothetical protein VF125_01220 [Solirubrobacterales bacterium]